MLVYAQQHLPRGLFLTIPHVSALIHSGSVSANSSCAYINQSERVSARVVQICAGGIGEIRAWQAQRARPRLTRSDGRWASQPARAPLKASQMSAVNARGETECAAWIGSLGDKKKGKEKYLHDWWCWVRERAPSYTARKKNWSSALTARECVCMRLCPSMHLSLWFSVWAYKAVRWELAQHSADCNAIPRRRPNFNAHFIGNMQKSLCLVGLGGSVNLYSHNGELFFLWIFHGTMGVKPQEIKFWQSHKAMNY